MGEKFGEHSLIYADTLLDFGYYLLHADCVGHAVEVYQKALDIHIEVLGGKNLLVAIAHEDLAYASYVYEYSSGRFKAASVVPARISSHCWRSPLPHASALIQRDFGCVLGVQRTKQLPHVAKVDLVLQLGV
ncbi:amyloid protein-binding protein 2 [Trichonephila clavipes]|nr:amyloid protein-binding protein 2 [Trichonephila clavipes]